MKLLTPILVLCLSLPALPADNASSQVRYNDLGHKIQCTCGCNEILLECNHVGCQSSDGMIRQLRDAVATYARDEDVLNWFRRNYGMTAVVTPATHGFELWSWAMPPLLAGTAFLLVVLLVRRWRLRAVPVGVTPIDPQMEALRIRARKETEL